MCRRCNGRSDWCDPDGGKWDAVRVPAWFGWAVFVLAGLCVAAWVAN